MALVALARTLPLEDSTCAATPFRCMYSLERGSIATWATVSTPELLPGTLYMLILRTLAAGPLHGYAIAKRVKEASREGISIEDGSLYPALNRMLVKGWLKAEWGTSENNRKARFYRLTAAGREQLERESQDFDRMVRAIQLVMRTV